MTLTYAFWHVYFVVFVSNRLDWHMGFTIFSHHIANAVIYYNSFEIQRVLKYVMIV